MVGHGGEILISTFDSGVERRTFGSTEKVSFYREDFQTGMEVVSRIIQAHTLTKSGRHSIYMVIALEVPAVEGFQFRFIYGTLV